MALRVYADANALIRSVEGEDAAAAAVTAILTSQRSRTVSSELTLAEVLVGPLRRSLSDPSDPMARLWRQSYEALFQKAGALQTVAVSTHLLREAAGLRAQRRALKLPDAIHLATAIEAGCDVLLTHDDDLLRAAETYLSRCSLKESDLKALLARIEAAP